MMQARRFRPGVGLVIAAAVALGTLKTDRALAIASELSQVTGTAAEIARDSSFWFRAQEAFTVDRSLVNLNNGGVSPAPAVVQEAMKRYLDLSNEAPSYTMWELLEPQIESVRQGLARAFGCDPEEMAITRNASEGLETVQLGLDLKPGDRFWCTADPGWVTGTVISRIKRGPILNLLNSLFTCVYLVEIKNRFSTHQRVPCAQRHGFEAVWRKIR